jgi:hypothetical protein
MLLSFDGVNVVTGGLRMISFWFTVLPVTDRTSLLAAPVP